MNKQEIQAALDKAKKQLAVAKEADEKAFAQKKIAKLEAELAEAEKPEEKPEKKKAAKKKTYKKGDFITHNGEKIEVIADLGDSLTIKVDNPMHPGKMMGAFINKSDINSDKGKKPKKGGLGKGYKEAEASQSDSKKAIDKISGKHKAVPGDKVGKYTIVEEGKDMQDVADGLKLKKVKDDVYTLMHKDKAAIDFVKKDNRWYVECHEEKNQRKNGFASLPAAVVYVAKQLYGKELKEYIASKAKASQRSKEWKKEHPSGELTAGQTAKKAVDKIVEKIEDKKEEGKSVEKDETAIINQIVELVKALSPEAKKKLIALLN